MSSNSSPSSDPVTHSEPIPINTTSSHRTRPRSASEASDDDSVPPLSPASESPASIPDIQTPSSSTNTHVPMTPVSPSSPILSYFYGSPKKSPFAVLPTSNRVFEDEESQEPPPTPASGMHARRVSTSWVPVRFGAQPNMPATESQQERGAGVLRRLSLSSGPARPILPAQARSSTPPNSPNGVTGPARNPSPRVPGQRRKAATLSAGTVDANKVPRAPSPMGERILKGFFDGF